MKKIFVLMTAVIFCLCIFAGLAATAKTQNLFPLTVGSSWRYKVMETNEEISTKVVGMEKIGNQNCYKMVSTLGKKGERKDVEYFYKTGNDVFQAKAVYYTGGYSETITAVNFNPPRKIVATQLKIGDSWNYKSKNKAESGAFQIRKALAEENVRVPAGKFNAMKVNIGTSDGKFMTNQTCWYADGVGLVRAVSRTDRGPVNTVLVEYKVK